MHEKPKKDPILPNLAENTETVGDLKQNGDKMTKISNAFEVLMGARGDTQKRTPVKTRIKRLEKNVRTTPTMMDKWARK